MNEISDTVMTLAAVAVFADSPTRIENVGHIRHKETDRLSATANELKKLGATVEEGLDFLVIHPPKKIAPAQISTYDDHRMAMAFSLVGLMADGIEILDPSCVAKTFPDYFSNAWRRFAMRIAIDGPAGRWEIHRRAPGCRTAWIRLSRLVARCTVASHWPRDDSLSLSEDAEALGKLAESVEIRFLATRIR